MTDLSPHSLRLTRLRVRNYRVLRDVELTDLSAPVALLGANGSGKSTVLDALAFVADGVREGFRKATQKRASLAKDLLSSEESKEIDFEMDFQAISGKIYRYGILIEVNGYSVVNKQEFLFCSGEEVFSYFDGSITHKNGSMEVGKGDQYSFLPFFARQGKDIALQGLEKFIQSLVVVSYFPRDLRAYPSAGVQENLSQDGENLANVLLYLHQDYPDKFRKIEESLRRCVPYIDSIEVNEISDSHVQLKFVQKGCDKSISVRYASDGTLRILCYFILMHHPNPPSIVLVEEPENHLHPKLMNYLAEEFAVVAERTQFIVTTHSPFFVNSLLPEQVWAFTRGEDGFAKVQRVEEMKMVKIMMENGGGLGDLWMENFFEIGNP